MTIPTFVVAGAARSGTTAVTEGLRSHPDVFVTSPKEPHYFAFAGRQPAFTGPGDHDTVNAVAVTDREAYLALYPSTHDYRALGEGSVSSLYYHDTAVPALLELNPAIRIVLVLRDPVERAYSSFQYLRSRGLEPLDSFEDALADEPRRIEEGWHHLWHYAAMSRYAESVRHVIDAFGRDQVGVWFYDDLVEDGPAVVRQVCEFIGVGSGGFESHELHQVNVSGAARSKHVQTLMARMSRSDTARRLVKGVVPFPVRERIRRANLTASDVPDSIRARLAITFTDDLDELEGLLDRPLPHWAQG